MALFRIAAVFSVVVVASSDSTNEYMQKLSILQRTGEFRASALAKAGEWFRIHQDPQAAGDDAGMAELKASNPEAYAVVNALLTKKSLGLLNSRHPTASMNPSEASDAAPDSPQAEPQIISKVPEAPVATPEVDVPVPAAPEHHDFLKWKPASDEQMVSNVLGMVAGLKGGSVPRSSPVNSVQSVQVPVVAAQPKIAAPELDVPVQPEADIDVPIAATPVHHDFLNWKPANDEQMVSNVLGMVAGLRGGNVPRAPEVLDSSAMNMQAPAVQDVAPRTQVQSEPEPAPQEQSQPQPQHQAQHKASVLSFDWGNTNPFQGVHDGTSSSLASPAMKMPRQDLINNPYLKGIDFSSELTPATTSQIAENSYLKSFDLNTANSAAEVKPQKKAPITSNDIGGPNKLTGFNWYN